MVVVMLMVMALFDCRSFSVGFDIITVSETVPNGPGSFTKKSSGDFR